MEQASVTAVVLETEVLAMAERVQVAPGALAREVEEPLAQLSAWASGLFLQD